MKLNLWVILPFILLSGYAATVVAAPKETYCNDQRCVNENFIPFFWKFTLEPNFRTTYPTQFLHEDVDCGTKDNSKVIPVPPNTYFLESVKSIPENKDYMLVNIGSVRIQETRPNASTKEEYKNKYLKDTLKLCRVGEYKVDADDYRRVGGMDTGFLVVPFKFRSGDIYGDAAIGPYISYKIDRAEILATAGITQISTVETGGKDIKSETGVTGSVGLKFNVKSNWSIGLIGGVDHLSGSAGNEWKYQDKWWWSFAIGHSFKQ
ncbi:hypothetical protein F901_00835 [Acinetobacter dispersus]|uniref:hypothetical protein n=1 Tax=Acinetobacter dispersus TaxID=70348 RepID=UPI0002CFBA35|nr:hypothetical protein [Acinetobacter dispersus]ENX53569.1 hypothetical protein F901_00835 [Acinetobacter dispersus]